MINTPHPTISVIIPAYNDAVRLERTLVELRRTREREYPRLELIVSVRPSRDGTERVAAGLADLVVEGGTVSKGRNNGARAASGEILVFLDADSVPAPGTLTAIARAARGRVIGSCTAYTDDPSFQARGTVLLINFLRWSGLVKGLSNLLFCDRELFHGDGVGYDETISLGEHSDFVRRARRSGRAFSYVRAFPGYTIAMDRHKRWGYFALLLFWFRWGVRSCLLGLDTRDLELEYWGPSVRPAAKEPQGSAAG